MKPLFVGVCDQYAASLHHLEETRGHLLNEDEYQILRKELLDELATVQRRPLGVAAATAIALAGCLAGILALQFARQNPVMLYAASIVALLCGAVLIAQSQQRDSGQKLRLAMLHSAREHMLVSDEEFARVRSRLVMG